MKNKILIGITVATFLVGYFMNKESSFIFNYYDSYTKISYRTIVLILAQVLLLIILIIFVVKKIRKEKSIK